MRSPYPYRRPLPWILRIPCTAFGGLALLGILRVGYEAAFRLSPGELIVEARVVPTLAVVTAYWLVLGAYGGWPLMGTVSSWQAPSNPNELSEQHRQGLRIIRRRRRLFWLSIAAVAGEAVLSLGAGTRPSLGPLEYSWVIFLTGYWYSFSRCPRCGYAFFARSTKRAAGVHTFRARCYQCKLFRNADRTLELS